MTYSYLSVDARYEHVRQGGHAAQRAPVSQGVLIVAGVRADGHRQILAVEVADTESEATYHQVFRDLKARGLSGVRLVTSDSHKGLKAAIDRRFQGASWQRCQVHFARDLVKLVGAGRRSELGARPQGDLRGDDARASNDNRRSGGGALAVNPSGSCAAAGRGNRGLSRLSGVSLGASRPDPHHERIGAVERRDQAAHAGGAGCPLGRFPNAEACLRLVTALCVEQSDEWVSGRRYLDLSDLFPSTTKEE